MATICLKRCIDVCGMDRVVDGPSAEGESLSWGAWMRKLGGVEGIWLKTPDATPDAPRELFRGGTALLSADTPAAAELLGTKKAVGPTTKSICRCCHCCQTNGAHRKPCSFLAGITSWKPHCAGRECNYTLRSTDDIKAYRSKLQAVLDGSITLKDLEDWMADQGVNTFHCCMWRVPHLSLHHGAPVDIMHIFFEGVARLGLGALSHWLTRQCNASVHQIPEALTSFANNNKTSRSDYPYINTTRMQHLREGMEGGLPSTDCAFPGTAAQIANTVLDIPKIFQHLVPPAKRKDLVWQMANLLCKVGRLLWRRSFKANDILELDAAIWDLSTVFLETPYLQHLWKPKHHYLTHVPLDILRWGPPRGYWCMNFEHENQTVKGAVTHSNYSNVLLSAADHMSMLPVIWAWEKDTNKEYKKQGAI